MLTDSLKYVKFKIEFRTFINQTKTSMTIISTKGNGVSSVPVGGTRTTADVQKDIANVEQLMRDHNKGYTDRIARMTQGASIDVYQGYQEKLKALNQELDRLKLPEEVQ
jgi:hypothetical protein